MLRAEARTSEWARRIRELRNDEGMDIVTHNDLADLKPGQYLLRSLKPQPRFEGGISKKLRALVLDRNGFTCQMCGAVAGEPHADYPGQTTRLQIGHIVDKKHGGKDEYDNLRALCSHCNEGASDLTGDRPTVSKLLTTLRRAPRDEQIAVLQWLARKYRTQAKEMLSDDV